MDCSQRTHLFHLVIYWESQQSDCQRTVSASRTSIHLPLPTPLENNLHTRLLRFASSRSSGFAVVEFHPVQPHLTVWKLAHGGNSHHPQLISPWPFSWTRRNAALRSIVTGEGLNPLMQQMASAPWFMGAQHCTWLSWNVWNNWKNWGEKKETDKMNQYCTSQRRPCLTWEPLQCSQICFHF